MDDNEKTPLLGRRPASRQGLEPGPQAAGAAEAEAATATASTGASAAADDDAFRAPWAVAALAGVLVVLAGSWLVISLAGATRPAVGAVRVPLEAHIMSKCPDARDCFQKLVLPTLANVSDKVDFRMSFIGTPTDDDDGVVCPHGQTECLGDVMMLCAAHQADGDAVRAVGFAGCLLRSYADIPAQPLLEGCALEHGLPFDALNECASRDDGAFAMGLLRDSVQRSMAAHVSTSCTLRLNDRVRCVFDQGNVAQCSQGAEPKDLIRDIDKLYAERNRA